MKATEMNTVGGNNKKRARRRPPPNALRNSFKAHNYDSFFLKKSSSMDGLHQMAVVWVTTHIPQE
jgi:hypothetical protein